MSAASFIVIGNFGVDYDPATQKYASILTGLSIHDFFKKVSVIADALGLEYVECFETSTVFKGSEQDYKYLKGYLSESFCMGHIDAENFARMQECEYGIYPQDAKSGVVRVFDEESIVSGHKNSKSTVRFDA